MIEQKKLRYDVVSAGGGLSGVFAAAASARAGAKTLLLERTGMLGGMTVQGMTLGEIYYRTDLLNEFLSILKELGGQYGSPDTSSAAINGETLRLALFRICRENNVDVLLYSEACSLQQRKDIVCGLTSFSKNELFRIEAPIVIDATGTGDLVRSAGVWNGNTPLYAYAAVILTGLNTAALSRCREQSFVEDGFATGQPGTQYRGPLYTQSPVCAVKICAEPGRCLVEFPVGCQVDPLSPLSRTQAITKAHLRSARLLEALGKTPGFENVRLSALPPQLILRQMPTLEAMPHALSNVPKRVVAAAVEETGNLQYFSLENLALTRPGGLMVCGKLAAAITCCTEDNFGTALFTGEAAGVCAALAAKKGCLPGEIDTTQIREILKPDCS